MQALEVEGEAYLLCARLSAEILAEVSWLRAVTVSRVSPFTLTVTARLPWWARFTFGALERVLTRRLWSLFHRTLPVGVRVTLRLR